MKITNIFKCKSCRDMFWVCENHPEIPSYGDPKRDCPCGGAGTPCKKCNPCDDEHPMKFHKGFEIIDEVSFDDT